MQPLHHGTNLVMTAVKRPPKTVALMLLLLTASEQRWRMPLREVGYLDMQLSSVFVAAWATQATPCIKGCGNLRMYSTSGLL